MLDRDEILVFLAHRGTRQRRDPRVSMRPSAGSDTPAHSARCSTCAIRALPLTRAARSESVARTVCGWMGKLPEDCRDAADEILAHALASGRPIAQAAHEAEVSESTAYRRLRDPDFQAHVAQIRQTLTMTTLGVLTGQLGTPLL